LRAFLAAIAFVSLSFLRDVLLERFYEPGVFSHAVDASIVIAKTHRACG